MVPMLRIVGHGKIRETFLFCSNECRNLYRAIPTRFNDGEFYISGAAWNSFVEDDTHCKMCDKPVKQPGMTGYQKTVIVLLAIPAIFFLGIMIALGLAGNAIIEGGSP